MVWSNLVMDYNHSTNLAINFPGQHFTKKGRKTLFFAVTKIIDLHSMNTINLCVVHIRLKSTVGDEKLQIEMWKDQSKSMK